VSDDTYTPEGRILTGSPLHQAAEKLLAAAADYWAEYRKTTGGAAVVWLTDGDGRLLIFTRGEYRERLMAGIPPMRKERHFEGWEAKP
jgi:hypothetical protein